jgi:asparaginyl-tRNA synthetase
MPKLTVSNIGAHKGEEVTLKGWVYNFRSSGKIFFLQFRDGTGRIQVVYSKADLTDPSWEALNNLKMESSVEVTGVVKEDSRAPSGFELEGKAFKVIQLAPEDYPIAKKDHGPDFLFEHRDLYLRSATPWSVLRIRDRVQFSIEQFLHEEGFIRFDTPVLQPTSCEDTTQLFSVDYYEDKMYLSQSGQLYSEAGIMAFGKVYDFGPVFRAEKSKTRHHLSEFWMMDAEMAFYDQDMNMDLQERLIKRVVSDVLEHCQVELKTLERDTTLLERLIKEPFPRLSHAEVKQLLAADGLAVDPLDDLTTEEELHLGKKYELPVFVVDYPLAVKAFYMKRYTDEQGVVRARCADLIAPEEGREIIGGSQREDDYETLLKEITDRNYSLEDYAWYLNTRKFGSVPHSGFGPGLERLVRWISGVHHIRETIPFPRNLTRNRP